jgi:predicted component of viral defense system (DUF524 family)
MSLFRKKKEPKPEQVTLERWLAMTDSERLLEAASWKTKFLNWYDGGQMNFFLHLTKTPIGCLEHYEGQMFAGERIPKSIERMQKNRYNQDEFKSHYQMLSETMTEFLDAVVMKSSAQVLEVLGEWKKKK